MSQSGRRAAEALIALGATHAQFQHRKETARALEEATRIAQQSGDEDALAKALALSGLLAESEYFDDDDVDVDEDEDSDEDDDEPFEESLDNIKQQQSIISEQNLVGVDFTQRSRPAIRFVLAQTHRRVFDTQ